MSKNRRWGVDRIIRNKISFRALLCLVKQEIVQIRDLEKILSKIQGGTVTIGEKAAFTRALETKSDLYAPDLTFNCLVAFLREYLFNLGQRRIYDREDEIGKWGRHLGIDQREMSEFVGLLEESLLDN